MNLLSPDVIAILLLDGILFLFALIALAISVQIVRKWDRNATTPLQYALEKRAYLVATIIEYIFYLKLPLFLYFIYTLDNLSNILPGAMCAAGVTNATVYGLPLFVVKILDLYLFGFWIVLHRIDMKKPDYPFTKMKFWFFILIFPFFTLEVVLEALHMGGINPHVIVSCCGTLFSAAKSSAVSAFITLPTPLILGLFYGNFVLIAVAWLFKRAFWTALFNLLFIPVAIVSLIAFFSTYVYEMPHHHCPFCLLQSDYHYVGYFLYTFLFGGTFYGIAAWIAEKLGYGTVRGWLNRSIVLDTLYLFVVSYYPISFYLKNGVWL
ncbi:hypothetical protein [Hydrogenimonas cancrithermarum]|uniref:Uncharacterized protein n=1 Tax=Hydrogenimonas cancrithermarum TaxID=2993563 RepID=A0ABN6WTX9_9BACT|nr:hypothetical protein [Hydrogenimonas cancrithermarum]BDY12423.1 hypothetical protein HCR_07350 [Hydrogenimonas cancrithermarum]